MTAVRVLLAAVLLVAAVLTGAHLVAQHLDGTATQVITPH